MTLDEFTEIMKPAIAQFGANEFNQYRMKLIYTRVHKLDVSWLKSIIHQMCLQNNRFFDFDEAARNEFSNRNKQQNTINVVKALEALSEHLTDDGYIKAMRMFGATNFWDAVKNCKEFKLYERTIPELETLGPVICEKMGV